MRLLVWNCRGAGNPRAVRALKDLILRHRPAVVFLSETKVHGVRMEALRSLFRFDSCFSVDSLGNGGGLSILWSNSVQLSIQSYSANFIDCEIRCSVRSWRFTGFYGFPESTRRRDSWLLLRSLAARSSLPWLCVGDYNDIAAASEKDGGPPRANFLINGFRAALLDSNLADIFTMGSLFTYVYRGSSSDRVREKLDRACATSSWNSLFENAVCTTLVAPVSDHSPLLVDTDGSLGRTNRNFRFDNSWLLDNDFFAIVMRSWQGSATAVLIRRRNKVIDDVQAWGKARNRLRWQQKRLVQQKLDSEIDSLDQLTIQHLKDKWNILLAEDEIRLKQQAKVFWIQNGDKNSKYFHNSIKARRRGPFPFTYAAFGCDLR
ncbi:hypothetical protein K2173_003125 [Erythroxylum novogranatense]|uniref:Endonuclease/exonuclease/phosphatase domain-containing protein n=1 Tax=Erythroxylum novogranatense TaxID=1862640 RepID=A0AAV8TC15_9ROSI|nr:hypothetical protein K2173_003125 [Erythroxylum novogranatense]